LKRAVAAGVGRWIKPFNIALRIMFAWSLEHCDDPVRHLLRRGHELPRFSKNAAGL
jgi:hypothetical protein